MDCRYFVLLLLLTGCSSLSADQKAVYEKGYRSGVKEQMQSIVAQFQGGNFPYYHWTSPIVQDVVVPGHISNGVFIPEHKELVIIKPGEWAKSPAYPIESPKENHEHTKPVMDLDTADITHLPNRTGPGDGSTGQGAGVAAGMGSQQ